MNGEAEFAEVAFEDVFIPDSGLLGELNKGWGYAMHTLSFERGCYMLRRTTDLAMDFQQAIGELEQGSSAVPEWMLHRIGELDANLYAFEAQSRPVAARLLPRRPDLLLRMPEALPSGAEMPLLWRRGRRPNVEACPPGSATTQ